MLPALKPIMMRERVSLLFIEYGQIDKGDNGRQNARGAVKSCRVPLIIEEQQLQWLHRKLHNAASIEAVVIHAQRPLYFRKDGKAGKIVTVTFDGLLRVLDPALLWLQMQHGIGPAKSFGCGLLSVSLQ